MAILNIRNLPDAIHTRLRVRAAEAGRSMEAEARTILAGACDEQAEALPAESLQRLVEELYGETKPSGVVDSLIAGRRRMGLFG